MSCTNLRDLVDCSICYSPLLEPKILQCGHTFCSECVRRLCQESLNQTFECPECRHLHSTLHHSIPTDYKLKQVVELMHNLCNDQKSNGQGNMKICCNCSSLGDIKNYFICETCNEEDLRVYCSLCIVKQHQSHKVREALDEAKLSTSQAVDENLEKISQIMNTAEFYRNRFEIQTRQIDFVFQMLLNFCKQTKESIDKDFKYEHAKLSELLNGFLEKANGDINRVFNESDNCIYHLCMTILSNFEQSFNVPSNAMDQLKAKIINHEEVDLFSFLYNLPKDDLPNIGPSTSSTVNPFESLIYNEEALSRPNVHMHSSAQLDPNLQMLLNANDSMGNNSPQQSSNNVGFGQKLYRRKKKR